MLTAALRRPSWVFPGAKLDLDFRNSRYWGGSIAVTTGFDSQSWGIINSGISGSDLTGASNAPDAYGFLHQFSQYQTRIVPGTGLWVEDDSTNNCLRNRQVNTSPWVGSNISTTITGTVGADGILGFVSQVTATANNATVMQTITLASSVSIFSAYIKRISGTGAIFITQDGGTTYTQIDSLLSTANFALVVTGAQTLTNPQVGFKIATSGDIIIIDMCQQESRAHNTTPMTTFTATCRRGVEEPALGDPSGSHPNCGIGVLKNIFDTGKPFSFVASHTGTPTNTGSAFVSDETVSAQGGCDGSTLVFYGATTINSGVAGKFNINYVGGRCNSLGSVAIINGGAISSIGSGSIIAQPGAMTHAGLGNNGSGFECLNGYIRRIAFWDQELSNGQLVEFTRTTNTW